VQCPHRWRAVTAVWVMALWHCYFLAQSISLLVEFCGGQPLGGWRPSGLLF